MTTTEQTPGAQPKKDRFISPRSLIFSLLGILFIAGTAKFHDTVLQGTYMIGHQIPPGPFFYFFLVGLGWNGFWNLLDRLLKKEHRLADRLALSARELAFVIIMTLVACWAPTSGLYRYFHTQIMMPWYFLPNHQNWELHGLLTEYLRPELFPTPWPGDPMALSTPAYEEVYRGFFTGMARGTETLSILELPLRAWIKPMLIWGPILTMFVFVMISTQFLVHRQWASHEQLAYPIAQVTGQFAHMTNTHHGVPDIFRNRLFWWGVIPVFLLLLIDYLAKWYPESLPAMQEFLPNLKGWNLPLHTHMPIIKKAINYWSLSGATIYFTFIGIAYFVSSEIALTVGLSQVLLAIFTILFYQTTGSLMQGQTMEAMRGGAYMGFMLILLYTGRSYYLAVFARALRLKIRRKAKAGEEDPAAEELAAPDEVSVLAARTLIVTFIAFVCILSWICQSWLIALLFSLILFMLYTVFSRIVCETGIPFLQPAWTPGTLLVSLLGPAAIGPHALTFLNWGGNSIFVQDPREALIAYVGTGAKIAEDHKINLKKVFGWICAAALLAMVIGWFAAAWSTYNYNPMNDSWASNNPPVTGLDQTARHFMDMKAAGTFETSLESGPLARLQLIAGNAIHTHYFFYGLLAVMAVSLIRFRFAKFPIHPILFLIWGSYPAGCAAASFFFGWFIKVLVVRFGGGGVYQRCKPLFVGIIAGEILLIGLTIIVDFAYYLIVGSPSPNRVWYMPG